MSPVRTQYLPLWQPPPFRPSTERRRWIPRGSGVEEGGDPTLIGRITVMVRPPGQITVGQEVTLTAVRTGGGATPLTYQWHGPDDSPIPGATGSSYTFTTTSPADSGVYRVVVDSASATDGPVTGSAAITVNPAPFTGDRILMEGGGGSILLEAGAGYILQEN